MDSLIDSNRLLQDTEEEQAGFGYLFRHNYPLFIAVMIGSSSFLAILMFTMRSWCYERYRRNCCPGALPESRRQQLWRERVAAEQRQRAMDQEVHEQSKATRREERRAWYNTYLKPFTMTVEEKDFCGADCADHYGSSSASTDVEKGDAAEPRCIYLPPLEKGGPTRQVEASCSICMLDYRVDDEVVWSTVEGCPHAYHFECILTWLARGKKRCPICRQWFVPGTRINEQKRELLRAQQSENGTIEDVDERDREEGDETVQESEGA